MHSLHLIQIDFMKKNEFLDKLETINRSKFVQPSGKEPMSKIAEQINLFYGKDECYILHELSRCQRLIIDYAKKGDFSNVEELIFIAKKALNKLKGEPRMLGAIYLYPTFAYYASKTNKIALAKRYLSLSVKYDDILSDKFPTLHIHKLHQTDNLGKIFIYSKRYLECANLYMDIFYYLSTYKLNPKYGAGDKTYFLKMKPDFDVSSASNMFVSRYFMTVWRCPIVESYILNDKKIENMFNVNIEDQYAKALRDTWVIQKLFLLKKPNYNLVLKFFEEYDFYLFDPLRLLILRSLSSMLMSPKEKETVINFIKTKLNFKDTTSIIKKMSNQLKVEN